MVNQLAFLQGDRDRLQAEIRILVARQLEVQSELEASSSVILGELEAANEEFDLVLTEWEKQEAERRRREEAERQRRAAAAAAASAAASAAAAAASNYTSSAATSARGRTCPVRGPHSFRNSWGEPRPGGRSHHGVDMVAANGTRLVAAESGTVYSPNWHYAGGIGLYLRGPQRRRLLLRPPQIVCGGNRRRKQGRQGSGDRLRRHDRQCCSAPSPPWIPARRRAAHQPLPVDGEALQVAAASSTD